MRRVLLHALLFAVVVAGVSLAVDLLVAVLYQGGPPPGRAREFLVFRSALHGATLVLTFAGALVGFCAVRARATTIRRVAMLGFVLGVVTLPVLLFAMRHGGFRAMAAWLLASSVAVPVAATMLTRPRRRDPGDPHA